MSDLLRKAAQAALEALEALYNGRADENRDRKCWLARVDLRAALAQPDQPTADGPTLPDTDYGLCFYDEGGMHEADGQGYTADQMLAFRAEGVAQERERCARVCEEVEDSAWALWKVTADPHEQGRSIGAQHCADAIRKG